MAESEENGYHKAGYVAGRQIKQEGACWLSEGRSLALTQGNESHINLVTYLKE
jgi:hypothetical protein